MITFLEEDFAKLTCAKCGSEYQVKIYNGVWSLGSIVCDECGHRVAKKVRPPIIKKLKAV